MIDDDIARSVAWREGVDASLVVVLELGAGSSEVGVEDPRLGSIIDDEGDEAGDERRDKPIIAMGDLPDWSPGVGGEDPRLVSLVEDEGWVSCDHGVDESVVAGLELLPWSLAEEVPCNPRLAALSSAARTGSANGGCL
jgi:hypothetical protein